MITERFKEENTVNRLSNASTAYSSDDEVLVDNIGTESNIKLFAEPKQIKLSDYEDLTKNLVKVFELLSIEIEPVNIRDHCSIHARKIGLGKVSGSCINKRRIGS